MSSSRVAAVLLAALALLAQALVPGAGSAATQGFVPAAAPITAADTRSVPGFYGEIEPNDQIGTATFLPADALVAIGAIFPTADVDVFAFEAQAGDRIYAATMTSASSSFRYDTRLDLLDESGATLESDNDDGVLASTSSSIAGAPIPTAGSYYLRVSGVGGVQVRPYHLYLRVERGTPRAEREPNNAAPEPLGTRAWISGVIEAAGDVDTFSVALDAGDTLYAALDLDPERDGVAWNGRLVVGPFSGFLLSFNDASSTSPNSEALFISAREAGVYTLRVDSPSGTGSLSQTYHLSVGLRRAEPRACTTYSSTAPPQAIGPGADTLTSTISIPDARLVGDLNLTVALTHALMADLDASLSAPDGSTIGLFTDVGSSSANQNGLTTLHATLDDEAAFPIGVFSVVNGLALQPEATYRLAWLDGKNAQGEWSLKLYDDTANDYGGVLQSWSISVCDPSPSPPCPSSARRVAVYSNNFEQDAGGFSSSGSKDQWAWGEPSAAPIDSSNSGTRAWKTNLSGVYTDSARMILRSPPIDLSGLGGPVELSWAHKYQLESASFDNYTVAVELADNPAISRTLFQHLDDTMVATVGSPPQTIAESAGWGFVRRTVDEPFSGQRIRLRFELSSDDSRGFGGVAVDDVSVEACEPLIPTETSLSAEPNPAPFGQPVTLTATVSAASGAPTGVVTFYHEGQTLGDVELTGNTATLRDVELPSGTSLISATYSGSPEHAPSSATPLSQSVGQAPTSLLLDSSANPAPLGFSTIITATVVTPAGEPTGLVRFFRDGSLVAELALVDGRAALDVGDLPAGTTVFSATYSGDPGHQPSSSLPLRQFVAAGGLPTEVFLPVLSR